MMIEHPIYLDWNATAPILPEVIDAMNECYQTGIANPASAHWAGQEARRVLDDTRDRLAKILNVNRDGHQDDQIIFTSGGTESNNLALRGLAGNRDGCVLVSSIEHPSVSKTVESFSSPMVVQTNSDGRIDLAHFEKCLESKPLLVSIMLANNETGIIQSIQEIAERCAEHQILLHTDAVQVVGKLPVDFQSLGVSAMSLSAHKFRGPQGSGALIVKGNVPIRPILFGGNQQFALRPGTEAVALAVGMLAALEHWHNQLRPQIAALTKLRDMLETRLLAGDDMAVVNGRGARLPQTTNISFLGLDRQALVMCLDRAGIACSTGSACASGSSEPSSVLTAMNCSKLTIDSSIRFSLGPTTTAADVELSVNRILSVVKDLRSAKSK